jgi:hypothetical protein
MADAPRAGWIRRAARALGRAEASLETSVWPWACLVALTALGSLVWVAVVTRGFDLTPMDDLPFDAVVWRADDGGAGASARGQMIVDLGERHLRVGTKRDALLTLLGPPDHTERGVAAWHVGRWSGSPGPDRLELFFDSSDGLLRWSCVL